MQKKYVIGVIALIFCLVLTGCKTEEVADIDEPLDGAYDYSVAYGGGLPEELEPAFDEALSGYDGEELTPITVISCQVVAGMNYRVVCRTASGELKLATVYVDLEGKGEITDVSDFTVEPAIEKKDGDLVECGGWGPVVDQPAVELEKEVKEALEKAAEELDGMKVEPLALLGSQVVAGTNYKILCRMIPVTDEPITEIHVIEVYADLDGGATISGMYDICQ